jgi:hypothetical protein
MYNQPTAKVNYWNDSHSRILAWVVRAEEGPNIQSLGSRNPWWFFGLRNSSTPAIPILVL